MKSVSRTGTAKDLKDIEGGCGVKTGTAQSSLNKKAIDHGWITGFYPEERPKYVITVLVEGTQKEINLQHLYLRKYVKVYNKIIYYKI